VYLTALTGVAMLAAAQPPPSTDPRDALMAVWPGEYDLTEEALLATDERGSQLGTTSSERIQQVVRPVRMPWLGSHVLYAEEFSYDDPADVRRQVLLSLEKASPLEGDVRVRQFTRKAQRDDSESAPQSLDDVESLAGCDLWLLREGNQFRGGTRGDRCVIQSPGPKRYVDYQLVVGESLLWYRRRIFDAETEDMLEEVAAFRYFDLEEARLFSCRVRWSADGARRTQREIDSFDVHDQGGRVRFRLPDGRELELELHGRDWPANSPRQSLVLILNAVPQQSEPLASSWTTLDVAQIGVDLGWVAIDCGPVVGETKETIS
jgi:hypothetical protein